MPDHHAAAHPARRNAVPRQVNSHHFASPCHADDPLPPPPAHGLVGAGKERARIRRRRRGFAQLVNTHLGARKRIDGRARLRGHGKQVRTQPNHTHREPPHIHGDLLVPLASDRRHHTSAQRRGFRAEPEIAGHSGRREDQQAEPNKERHIQHPPGAGWPGWKRRMHWEQTVWSRRARAGAIRPLRARPFRGALIPSQPRRPPVSRHRCEASLRASRSARAECRRRCSRTQPASFPPPPIPPALVPCLFRAS